MTLRAVCFDLDDTLYDYHEYARAGLAAAADRLERVTGERHHEELERLYFDRAVTDGTFDRLVERHDLPGEVVDDLVDAFHDASTPLDPYPATEEVLSRLGAEYALGLVTDGRGGHRKLERLGIRDAFDAVMVTPTVDRSKRDPVVFERVLSVLSVPPAATAYVGDDPRVDFRVPNEMGMTTVRLRRGRHVDREPPDAAAVPDHELARLADLPGLVNRIDGTQREAP